MYEKTRRRRRDNTLPLVLTSAQGTLQDEQRPAHNHLLHDIGEILWGVFFPQVCPGCGMWDTDMCVTCEKLAHTACPEWTVLDVPGPIGGIPLISLGPYEGRLRHLVLAAKHSPTKRTRIWLAQSGATLASCLVEQGLCRWPHAVSVGGRGAWWIVPAPPSWHRRIRGPDVTLPLAKAVAKALSRSLQTHVSVVEALGLRLWKKGQSGRSGAQRKEGRTGSMRLRVPIPRGCNLLLVDDVVTTGATAREMIRVLDAPVTAFLSIARA